VIRRLLLSSIAVVLAGCSAFGNDQFQCPANVEGATCMSAREVYSATHVSDRVAPNYKDGKRISQADGAAAAASSEYVGSDYQSSGTTAGAGVAPAVVDKYRPPLPEVDVPLPVRVPAKVMRIRIFPWEDNARDLNAGSVVFTEVEGRTWTLGEEQTSRVQPNVINPLAPPRGSLSSTSSMYQAPLAAPPAAATKKEVAPGQSQTPAPGK